MSHPTSNHIALFQRRLNTLLRKFLWDSAPGVQTYYCDIFCLNLRNLWFSAFIQKESLDSCTKSCWTKDDRLRNKVLLSLWRNVLCWIQIPSFIDNNAFEDIWRHFGDTFEIVFAPKSSCKTCLNHSLPPLNCFKNLELTN